MQRIESILLKPCGTYRYFWVFASLYPLETIKMW